MINRTSTTFRSGQHGGVLAVVAHVLLLLLVLGQIVYLASRNRVRWDLTSDRIYTLTDSTKSILAGLDKQLLIEAYFSPKDKLPVAYRETRVVLDNFLDELVQLGRGKVVVQRFDPNSDKAISERCTRRGVKPIDLRGGSATSVSVDRHWQGLRFVYGGSKQKVLAQAGPQSPSLAEALLTPAIKEVVTTDKARFGYMEWPSVKPNQGPGVGWNTLRTLDAIAKRYEFENFKNEDAPLLPDDLGTLFLFRPENLTDREKYVLDQFVVNGGTLMVFLDAADYWIGERQQFGGKNQMVVDAADSKKTFADQLRHYGIEWKQKVLADMIPDAHRPRNPAQPQEYLAQVENTVFGRRPVAKTYPYFFHAVNVDWSQVADQLARDPQTKQVDQDLAAAYRKQFGAGMPSDEFIFAPFKKINRGPGFYWPTWVGLRSKAGGEPDLPEGVEGRVHLWSSPAVLVADPPQNLNPFGYGDARAQNEAYLKFITKLNERFYAEPRQQAPLMAEVRGTFRSFFAGDDRPKRPSEIQEEEAAAAKAAKAADADEGDKPGEGEAEASPPAEVVGPEPPEAAADEPVVVAEADMVEAGSKAGRIVVIGDSDFVRDDFVGGQYAQQGGPVSVLGGAFFNSLLDWLAEDSDLVALQSHVATDRTMQFLGDATPGADPRAIEQALTAKLRWLRWLNVILPVALLSVFGLVVFSVRRAQKRAFLESVA